MGRRQLTRLDSLIDRPPRNSRPAECKLFHLNTPTHIARKVYLTSISASKHALYEPPEGPIYKPMNSAFAVKGVQVQGEVPTGFC